MGMIGRKCKFKTMGKEGATYEGKIVGEMYKSGMFFYIVSTEEKEGFNIERILGSKGVEVPNRFRHEKNVVLINRIGIITSY